MIIYLNIDDTVCDMPEGEVDYSLASPIEKNINKANKMFDEGWKIIYWTARGSVSTVDYRNPTLTQLNSWGCKFHDLSTGSRGKYIKPACDLVIDDKAKRIEEL